MEFYGSGKDALLTRYMLKARTGSNLADVYQSSVFPIMNLAEKGLLAKYYSPEREGFIEELPDKDGYWHATHLNAVTMAYNSRMLKADEVPRSYQDLLQPKWKEKMGSCSAIRMVFRHASVDGRRKRAAIHGGAQQAKDSLAHRQLTDESADDGGRISFVDLAVSDRR
jgi:ABC-type Fe3+ transport system substrate-binding protein